MVDVIANRKARKWSKKELLGRILWGATLPFFSMSPRLLWGWRCWILRLFGAKIGKNVRIFSSVKIMIPWNLDIGDFVTIGDGVNLYALGPITIGQSSMISQGAHLCAGTHDYRDPTLPLLKQPITIGEGAWVCADAFIGPKVIIGDRAIVGARAVAMKDVASNMIVAGNPAKIVKPRE